VKYDRVKYDWSSRNAATLAMVSLAAYYLWRGISGHLVIFVFGANIVAIVVASLLGGTFLRRRLALFVSVLCIDAGITFFSELKCNPKSVCSTLSGIVLVVNVGVLYFLLKPTQGFRIEV
jgi:hypothetical protein